MELRDVEVFLTLAEELHFGRTARRLQITQGRVSQIVQALEREIGGALFERSSRNVRLTALGEEFRVGARQGHDELMSTLATCKRMARGVGGTLHIGYLPSIGLDFVADLIKAFKTADSGFEIIFRAVHIRFLYLAEAPLSDPKLDVVLLWCPGGDGRALEAPGFTVGPILAKEGRGVLVPVGHPLASHNEISMEDLASYTLIDPGKAVNPAMRDLWTPRFTPSGKPIRQTPDDLPAMTGTHDVVIDDVMTLVLAGRGLHCTIVSLLDRFPCPELVVVPVRDMPPMVVVPVWKTVAENATIRMFIRVVSHHSDTYPPIDERR